VLDNQHTVDETLREIARRALGERLSLRGICRLIAVSLAWMCAFAAETSAPEDLGLSMELAQLKSSKRLKIMGYCLTRHGLLSAESGTRPGYGWFSNLIKSRSWPSTLEAGESTVQRRCGRKSPATCVAGAISRQTNGRPIVPSSHSGNTTSARTRPNMSKGSGPGCEQGSAGWSVKAFLFQRIGKTMWQPSDIISGNIIWNGSLTFDTSPKI
jgi:hypothetical protein